MRKGCGVPDFLVARRISTQDGTKLQRSCAVSEMYPIKNEPADHLMVFET